MPSPYFDLDFIRFLVLSTVGTIYAFFSYVYAYTIGPRPVIRPIETSPGTTKKKIAIVTGSNTGIGYETARSLVCDHGVDVILACRSRDKAVAAADRINDEAEKNSGGAKALFLHPCDFTSFDSVRNFAEKVKADYKDGIDLLINNAGVSNSQGRRTEDDLELIFQTNFLGHFLLTNLLMDLVLKKEGSRIVNLASVFHHFVGSASKLDTAEHWKTVAKNDTTQTHGWVPTKLRSMTVDFYASYPPSKLAAVLFSQELNRRFPNIKSFAADPGAVNSEIYRDTPALFQYVYWAMFLTCKQGCQTSVAAAVGEDLDPRKQTGVFLQPYWMPPFANSKNTVPHPVLEFTAPFVGYAEMKPRLPLEDEGAAAGRALWAAAEELTGCKFDS